MSLHNILYMTLWVMILKLHCNENGKKKFPLNPEKSFPFFVLPWMILAWRERWKRIQDERNKNKLVVFILNFENVYFIPYIFIPVNIFKEEFGKVEIEQIQKDRNHLQRGHLENKPFQFPQSQSFRSKLLCHFAKIS